MKHTCWQCDKEFEGRSDAKFCSSTCRSRQHRHSRRVIKFFDETVQKVELVALRAKPDNGHYVVLKEIERKVAVALHIVERAG